MFKNRSPKPIVLLFAVQFARLTPSIRFRTQSDALPKINFSVCLWIKKPQKISRNRSCIQIYFLKDKKWIPINKTSILFALFFFSHTTFGWNFLQSSVCCRILFDNCMLQSDINMQKNTNLFLNIHQYFSSTFVNIICFYIFFLAFLF